MHATQRRLIDDTRLRTKAGGMLFQMLTSAGPSSTNSDSDSEVVEVYDPFHPTNVQLGIDLEKRRGNPTN